MPKYEITEIGSDEPPTILDFNLPRPYSPGRSWRLSCDCGARFRTRDNFMAHAAVCRAYGLLDLTEDQKVAARQAAARITGRLRAEQRLLDANRPALREVLLTLMGQCPPEVRVHAHDTILLLDSGTADDDNLNNAVSVILGLLHGWRGLTEVRGALTRFERATRG